MAITKAGTRQFLWSEGDLVWKLHETQRKIDQAVKTSPADEILVLASRQLGKSWWGDTYALANCILKPGTITRILAPTLKMVQDIVADNLAKITRDAPPGLIVRQKSDYRWQVGSSSLRLGALERAHVDNNRGGNADLIIIEEGCFVTSDDYIYARQQVLLPQVLLSKGKIIDVTTIDKDQPDHYILTELKPRCALKDALHEYTIYDNPQLTLEDIEKACERAGGPKSITWLVEYLNQTIRNHQTVVIPTFDKTKHVREITLPGHFHMQVAIDFGGVRDKTVALLHTYDFLRNKRVWLDERVFEANTDTSIIVRDCLAMEREYKIAARYADCHGQTQIDLEGVHQYPIIVPVKDDWKASINSLQVSIGRDEHEIDPRCRFLIQSLESGRFNKQRTDFERTSVLGHCDALAAMMYGNRMVNMENPFPYIYPDRDTTFKQREHKEPMEIAAEGISPKTFANSFDNSYFESKKFGTFKR